LYCNIWSGNSEPWGESEKKKKKKKRKKKKTGHYKEWVSVGRDRFFFVAT
jgi:hypothetical protein